MAIQSVSLPTSPANIYVSSGSSAITAIYLHNAGGSAAQFTINAVASGNIVSATNRIYANVLVQSGDTYVIDNEKLILGTGDFITANASATSSIVATISFIGI